MSSVAEWRDAVGFEGSYRVSNHGQVQGVKYGKMLKPDRASESSVPRVTFLGQKKKIPTLVLEAFGPDRKDGEKFHHLDGDVNNNRIDNLAWRFVKSPDAEWRVVEGFENYEVSDRGEVYTRRYNKLMLPDKHPNGGHLRLGMTRQDGKNVNRWVHHLVLEAFGRKRSYGEECRHLDGNPENNCIDNLQWGTGKENAADKRRHGKQPMGSTHGATKLNEEDVLNMRWLHHVGVRVREISEIYDVSHGCASKIVYRDSWAHVGGRPLKPQGCEVLSDEQVRQIRDRLSSESQASIARRFKCSNMLISNINRGKSYANVT